jgi:Spy/CpxP family protein refolding chaperone
VKQWIIAAAVIVLATVAGAGTAVAQDRGADMRQRMMEMMFKDITLTDAQKAQIDTIQAKYQKEMPAFTPGQPPSDTDREKRRELMQKQRTEIRGVLTDEQKVQFDRNIAEMPRGGRRPPGR